MKFGTSALALAAVLSLPQPALAQDESELRDAIAQLRSQMAEMAARIDSLESELATAQAQAETQAEAAQNAATAARDSALAAAAAATQAQSSPAEIGWKGAPRFAGEGGFSFKPRGRLQYDAGFVQSPDSTGRIDGFGNEARRARLGVQGDLPGGFGYKFELDFAGDSVQVNDAILTFKDGGVTVALGQQNNFQGLEELTSSLFISQIERAAFTDAFGFERRLGASVQYSAGDVLVQAGLFTDNIEDLSNRNWSADGRVVVLPIAGNTRFHLGGSLHYADLEPGETVRYRQRPLVHFTGNRFINTGGLAASSELGIGVEGAMISGPFHAAAEGYWQKVSRPSGLTDPTFFGGYAEVGYFLTRGDTRGYKGGKFDRVKPANPVGEGGFGAVQVNLRFDYLDLNDAGIIGGRQNGIAVSLIWTPTDYTRFMMNYGTMSYDDAVFATASGDTSYSVDAFAVRAQVDF